MREIKFRGKTQVTNGFVYGYYIRQYGCRNGIKFFNDYIYSEDELYYPIDINTLGQYTGLKDRNGVEIYEGDIVEGFSRNAVVKIGFPHDEKLYPYGVCVEYIKYNLKEVEYVYKLNLEDLEVIGNIYENRELLEA